MQFCRRAGLITGQLVAIDGSKFQAVPSARKHLSLKQLKRQQDALEKHIAQYLAQLDAGDAEETQAPLDRAALRQALPQLRDKHDNNLTAQGDGQQFPRSAFSHDERNDCYQCPAGKTLTLKQLNRGSRIYSAEPQDCSRCPLKPHCTQAKQRYLSRTCP